MRSRFRDIAGLYRKFGKNIPRFVATFLDNRKVFLSGAAPSRGPLAAVYNLSASCDANCPFCGYRGAGSGGREELSTPEKLKLVRDLASSGVWMLSLCAAEPLLVADIERILEEAKKSGLVVNISTNGSRLKDKAASILDIGVDSVTVSADSHSGVLHDKVRGSEGLFAGLSSGIDELKVRRKGARPWLAVRCLVSGRNWFSLREYVRYWSGRVDEIIFKPMSSSADGRFSVPDDMAADPRRESEFRDYFDRILRENPSLDTAYHREVPSYLFGGAASSGAYCFAGSFFADIDLEGFLHPCTEYGLKLGNVSAEGFMKVWTSPGAREFRKKIKMTRKCPRCWGDKFASGGPLEHVLKMLGGV